MDDTKKIVIALLIITMLILLVPTSSLFAQASYNELPKHINQPLDKEWTITFNQPIDPSNTNVNSEKFYIIDQSTNQRHPVELKASSDKRQVEVIPLTPYNPETEYRLYIEKGIRTLATPHRYLQQSATFVFVTTNNDTPPLVPGTSPMEPEVLDDLKIVSTGLERVIDTVATEAEKDVARAIKRNIDQKIENQFFDHLAELPAVRSRYSQLSSIQKDNLMDAILYNISAQRLMRLAEYFGF